MFSMCHVIKLFQNDEMKFPFPPLLKKKKILKQNTNLKFWKIIRKIPPSFHRFLAIKSVWIQFLLPTVDLSETLSQVNTSSWIICIFRLITSPFGNYQSSCDLLSHYKSLITLIVCCDWILLFPYYCCEFLLIYCYIIILFVVWLIKLLSFSV